MVERVFMAVTNEEGPWTGAVYFHLRERRRKLSPVNQRVDQSRQTPAHIGGPSDTSQTRSCERKVYTREHPVAKLIQSADGKGQCSAIPRLP